MCVSVNFMMVKCAKFDSGYYIANIHELSDI